MKKLIPFVPLFAVLAGCVATMPELPNNTQTPAGANRSNPPVADSKGGTPKIELPEGTVEGAKFLKEFRPELYLSNQQASKLFQDLLVRTVELGKFPNAIEKKIAVDQAKATPYVIDVEQKTIPKYLVYRVVYLVTPTGINMNTGNFYIKPNYSAKIPGITFGHMDRVPCRNERACFYSRTVFGMGDNNFEIASYPYKSNKNRENISKMSLSVAVQPGFTNSTYLPKGMQHTSNQYVPMLTTIDEVREILKDGHPFGQGGRAYAGYSILKVNSIDCKQEGNSSAQVWCDIDSTPTKYIVENFMGKSQFEVYPKEFSVHSSQLKAPLTKDPG
jgi:hypothetical protein